MLYIVRFAQFSYIDLSSTVLLLQVFTFYSSKDPNREKRIPTKPKQEMLKVNELLHKDIHRAAPEN